MPAVASCPGIVVTNGRTCDMCGRRAAKYTNHRKPDRPVEWGHLRGSTSGTVPAHRALLAAETHRADDAEGRLRILEAANDDRLTRIEAKLDTLLSRPAGMVEWKPDHRRMTDGGAHVQRQRRTAGVGRPARLRAAAE